MAKQKSSTPVFTVIACGQSDNEPQVIATMTDRQPALFPPASRTLSLDELLAEMKARTTKGHPRFYHPFAPDEAAALRAHHAAQVPPLELPLATKKRGVPIATEFERVVVGDYGAFVEIAPEHIVAGAIAPRFKGPPCRPVKYIWLVVKSDDVKVYHQQARVAYADYRVGMYYVAVSDVRSVSPEHTTTDLPIYRFDEEFAFLSNFYPAVSRGAPLGGIYDPLARNPPLRDVRVKTNEQ